MKNVRKHFTYSNVVSSLCLFLLLGGGAAFAATRVAKHSVGPNQLKKNAVNTAKLKNRAVTAAKLRDGAVTNEKIADGSVSEGKLADGSVSTAKIADGAVNSAKVLDKSLTGGDVANDTLTGANIDETTLGQVPDAAKLQGKAATAFTSSSIYKKESAVEQGTPLGDGTYYIDEACEPGDVLLDGGPANVNATSVMVESFPTPGLTDSWRARIKPGATDNFSVVVLCAKQG